MAFEELETSANAARAEVGPQQEALRAEREHYSERMRVFIERRAQILDDVGDAERRVYDAFHQSGRSVIVAPLLEDGACGHCFGMIPLQLQNEIRRSSQLIRCENCGVILTTEPEPVLDQELESPVEMPAPVGAESPAEGDPGEEAGELGPTAGIQSEASESEGEEADDE